MRHIVIKIEESFVNDEGEPCINGLLAILVNALNAKHALRICLRMIGDDNFAYETENQRDEETANRLLNPVKRQQRNDEK